MDVIVHGQCGNCGGRVTTPRIWSGIGEPVPTCETCFATKRSNLPVIAMNPTPRDTTTMTDAVSAGNACKVTLETRKP